MSDSVPERSSESERGAVSWKLSLLLSTLVLAAAGGVAVLTFFTEPTAEKGGATKKTAMLVEVVKAESGSFRPTIVAQGTVEPAREIVLRSQLEGRITSVAESFKPGGDVEKGQRLVQIERADYRHALAQRNSELREAETQLAVEKGRHDAAEAEYDRFGERLSEENEALVLREPQLEAARERVRAARAAVEQARLNLRRTGIEAPFDAHIVRRDVNVGSQVSSSDSLARLVGTDAYWVAVELPLSKLRWVRTEEEAEEGSRVRIRNRQAWPPGVTRTGHLFEHVGRLDEKTRMARVLAKIPDPLAQEGESEEKPALVIGEYVEVRIRGEELENVVRLHRDYVREDDTVWLMRDGSLTVNDLEIAVRDDTHAYVRKGLEGGDRVVTTNLSTVTEGAPLRLDGMEGGSSGE